MERVHVGENYDRRQQNSVPLPHRCSGAHGFSPPCFDTIGANTNTVEETLQVPLKGSRSLLGGPQATF